MRRAVIHQDANENNVLVTSSTTETRLSGLIDFGDAGHTVLVAEPAIAAAYIALEKQDPLTAMATLVGAFHREHPLLDEELECVFDLALLRLATSVAVSSERAAAANANPYHLSLIHI